MIGLAKRLYHYNHHMETITRIILLGLLASVAYLAYRLDSQDTAHAEATAAMQAEREANLAQLQTLERQHAERINEIESETQGKLEKVNRDAATARRAADGLRGQLADFAKRSAATDSTTACECKTEQGRIELLAKLLGELDSVAGEYAREADESRQRGLACEMSYEAVR